MASKGSEGTTNRSLVITTHAGYSRYMEARAFAECTRMRATTHPRTIGHKISYTLTRKNC